MPGQQRAMRRGARIFGQYGPGRWPSGSPQRSQKLLHHARERARGQVMMAAQLVAAYNPAIKCYRRAMIGEQTFEGRRENLAQANKLSRTYAALVEALNRHRGKGQQKVTVEQVSVHAGGQAVVGAVAAQGGVASGNQRKPHAQEQALTYAPVAPLWSENPERET